ncbi:DUF4065 domain-containing protein [Haloterrigena sp. SYSU A558-1]|uniref:DUF4065 domain-containing protein n=1 Tax=Haloterrigena gelatinilytica TaxID=2741724 RepID=A0ABX2LK32_9EURY|nr:type II toxin-antitoxin system antitoxin SocA domain-containing protein [Haloterrigena gelatinilytica]NUC74763.1 DUF4065 domain-containing protein [Haloterrigena gelatinilytica]
MHRKLLPLALMYADDGEPIEGRTRLQKLVFLMQKELEQREQSGMVGSAYEFIPYDYGPFSKDLYDDLDAMINQQFVDDTEEPLRSGKVKYVYEIEDDGQTLVETESENRESVAEVVQVAQEIKEEYNDMLLSDLIEFVYSEYPDYAERSVY